jgi:hypothetical protein
MKKNAPHRVAKTLVAHKAVLACLSFISPEPCCSLVIATSLFLIQAKLLKTNRGRCSGEVPVRPVPGSRESKTCRHVSRHHKQLRLIHSLVKTDPFAW